MLLIPIPLWDRFMAIRVQKVALLEVFHDTTKAKFNCEKRAGICWHVWQSYSLNANTVTQNFTFDFVAVPCRGKRLGNYLEIWRSHKRLGDKSMSTCPHFSLEIKESLTSREKCGEVFLEIRSRIHDTTKKPFLGIRFLVLARMLFKMLNNPTFSQCLHGSRACAHSSFSSLQAWHEFVMSSVSLVKGADPGFWNGRWIFVIM